MQVQLHMNDDDDVITEVGVNTTKISSSSSTSIRLRYLAKCIIVIIGIPDKQQQVRVQCVSSAKATWRQEHKFCTLAHTRYRLWRCYRKKNPPLIESRCDV